MNHLTCGKKERIHMITISTSMIGGKKILRAWFCETEIIHQLFYGALEMKSRTDRKRKSWNWQKCLVTISGLLIRHVRSLLLLMISDPIRIHILQPLMLPDIIMPQVETIIKITYTK